MYPKDQYARSLGGNSHDQDTRSQEVQNPYVVTITTIMRIMMSDKSISKEESKKYITLLRQQLDTWEKQTCPTPEKRKGDDKPEPPKKKKKPINPLRNILWRKTRWTQKIRIRHHWTRNQCKIKNMVARNFRSGSSTLYPSCRRQKDNTRHPSRPIFPLSAILLQLPSIWCPTRLSPEWLHSRIFPGSISQFYLCWRVLFTDVRTSIISWDWEALLKRGFLEVNTKAFLKKDNTTLYF